MKTISVHTARPTIEVCSKKAIIEIKNRHSRRMKVSTVRPRMKVERSIAPANKNWVKTGARMGQKPLENFIQYLSDSELKKLLDPNEIMKDEPFFKDKAGSSANGEALANNLKEDLKESEPKSEWITVLDPGQLKIDWTAGEVLIEWEDNIKPEIKVTPHEVVIRVKGNQGVKIRVDEEKLPFLKGKKINKHV